MKNKRAKSLFPQTPYKFKVGDQVKGGTVTRRWTDRFGTHYYLVGGATKTELQLANGNGNGNGRV